MAGGVWGKPILRDVEFYLGAPIVWNNGFWIEVSVSFSKEGVRGGSYY